MRGALRDHSRGADQDVEPGRAALLLRVPPGRRAAAAVPGACGRVPNSRDPFHFDSIEGARNSVCRGRATCFRRHLGVKKTEETSWYQKVFEAIPGPALQAAGWGHPRCAG